MIIYSFTTYIADLDADVIVECEYTPGDPGQCSGPPERCCEPTADEVEISAVTDEDGKDVVLTEAQAEELADRLCGMCADRLRDENDFARDGRAADAELWRD